MAQGCSDCSICGRTRYRDAGGNCYCKLCGYDTLKKESTNKNNASLQKIIKEGSKKEE